MQQDSAHEIEPLLAHAGFVRRLAQRLASDADDAEDLTQETWLALLRGRSRPRGSPRAFLAGVLRRRALQRARSEGRRRDREGRASEPELVPSAAEALERAELGRELALLVIELEEPFRSAVLLRHVSDLPPRAIAERLGVPLKTVESRLARGHARLRERWRRRCAERGEEPGAWLASLAWLGERSPGGALAPATPPILGALIVNTKLVLLVLAVAGGSGLLWLAVGTRSEPSALDARPSSERLAAAPQLEDLERDALESPLPVERAALPAAAAAAPAPEAAVSAPAAELFPLRGRVVDPEVRPLAGIEVACGSDARAKSAASGGFELFVPAGPFSVQVADVGLENLFRVRTRVPSQGEVLLVAAPHRALAGTVRDAAGRPIAGARVSLELPLDFRTRFDVPFDAIDLTEWTSATEDDGRFELGRAPLVEGALVQARLEGYVTATVPAPPFADADLELVLVPPDLGEWMLAGRVVDPAGAPVAGALVSLGARCATAAADGTFRLDRSDAREATVLRAVHAGRLPAVWQALPDPVTGTPSWPEWIELELGGEPLELAGRVVDQDGAPRPDVLVWIDDPTEFGVLDTDDGAHVEFLCSPAESTYSSGDSYFRSTRTDEQGRFRIQGLLQREYRLGLLHAETLERATAGPHAAGPGELELVLPRPEPAPLEVRLLSRSGEPVAGASIGLNVAIFGGVHHPRSSATTDAEGRVRFEGVAGSPLSLWIRGEGIVPVVQGISRPERGEVVLHVDVLCHFKIDLGDRPELADGVRALDAQGNELILYDLGANGYWSTSVAPLVAGKSVTLGVSETAAELVLELEDVEVRRIPIDLRPGELQVVTL